jgi:acetylornithine deacetylase/succinyl-diaminopimelate desuccinylase-like protein
VALTTTDFVGTIDRERALHFARQITAVGVPDGREGPRAELMADLLEHPRLDVVVDPALPGRPNVIVRLRGTGDAPGLLLNGHIDASYVGADEWSHDPLDPWVDGNRLYGGAVSDMLGGVASLMETMRAAADLEPLPGDLVLLANMHHDSNGLGTKYALATEDGWPRYGINGEPTSMSILTTHGGCVKFEVRFRGRVAHVSRSEEGRDALEAATRFIDELKSSGFSSTPDADLPTLPRYQIGVLSGGFAAAAVAPHAVLQGDVRTVPRMTWETVGADLRAVADRACPEGVQASVHCLVRQRPLVGPKSGPLFDALASAHRSVTGRDVEVNIDRAAQSFVTDGTDMAAAGIETVVYGPGAWHFVADEYIDIDEMADAARVYLLAAARLMGIASE